MRGAFSPLPTPRSVAITPAEPTPEQIAQGETIAAEGQRRLDTTRAQIAATCCWADAYSLSASALAWHSEGSRLGSAGSRWVEEPILRWGSSEAPPTWRAVPLQAGR